MDNVYDGRLNISDKEMEFWTVAKALGKYLGNDNSRKPKAEYIEKVYAMSDEELEKECDMKIWLSAYASNNPRSDYHWHANVCYDAAQDRDNDASIYERAYDKLTGNL